MGVCGTLTPASFDSRPLSLPSPPTAWSYWNRFSEHCPHACHVPAASSASGGLVPGSRTALVWSPPWPGPCLLWVCLPGGVCSPCHPAPSPSGRSFTSCLHDVPLLGSSDKQNRTTREPVSFTERDAFQARRCRSKRSAAFLSVAEQPHSAVVPSTGMCVGGLLPWMVLPCTVTNTLRCGQRFSFLAGVSAGADWQHHLLTLWSAVEELSAVFRSVCSARRPWVRPHLRSGRLRVFQRCVCP